MKLKEIHRTSTFAWSPSAFLPLLATGTVAGALDESFSNESQLEIWAPDFLDKDEYDLGGIGQHGSKGFVQDTARFNRLSWGYVGNTRPQGVIAAGLENGELALWDPAHILAGSDISESLILRNTIHTGPVRGLDFNPIQTNLLASGGINGEVYIWDLKDPSKPYTPTPGSRSTKLDDITSVAWNQQVQYVLAGASSTGYTVVWDLRGKREVVALAYGGGAGTLAGQGAGGGMGVGGRRGMSDIAWHPDNATRVVTASEDDSSPIIMVWDLRNARAPEKILTGHEKGVLSLSWCKQDADLLLSCGKDNRALCWNPQTSEIIGELPSADNWAFQVDWCPRNPDMLATAFFDGTIGIHSIQSTNDAASAERAPAPQPDGADIFDAPGFARLSTGATLSLKQPPKWLRRPVSSSFGFGGKLVTVSNLPSSQGKNQSSSVHVRSVVTEQDLVERAQNLQNAINDDTLKTFAEDRIKVVNATGEESWKAMLSLFKANSRDELVTLLGFSKSEVAARVAEAVENLKAAAASKISLYEEEGSVDLDEKTHEPVVSFAEPERQEVPSDSEAGDDSAPSTGNEKTPSEISGGVLSDSASVTLLTDGESTTTVPSLFGDDDGPGTPQHAGHDFFNTVGVAQGDGESLPVHVPHMNYGLDSSVAATIGSGPSSVTSEMMKNNSFRIYPIDDLDTDRLVTKALVLGDFESAVSLCLSSDRFADAILLAARGGPELLQRTQKAYFERCTTSLPYLRLFQSIVTNDLADIVQNADLQEWQEIFVVICTFASQEDFSSLAEQLGARLEFQFALAKSSGEPEPALKARPYRKNATLTYLAAARLERLINIWAEELLEEERKLLEDKENTHGSQYSAHAHALETFMEKVAVFRSATSYKDEDLGLKSGTDDALKSYKLSGLYERYFEYADLLSAQGLLKEAASFLKLIPAGFKGSSAGADFSAERDRLLAATSTKRVAAAAATSASTPASRAPYGYVAPAAPIVPHTQPAIAHVPSTYAPYQPAVPAVPNPYGVQQHQPTSYQPSTYDHSTSLTQPPHLRAQPQPPVTLPPPPRAANGIPSSLPPVPPKRDNGGWNDAPALTAHSRPPAALNLNKPAAITAPFPNAAQSPGYSPVGSPYMNQGQPSATLPPPPRPGSVQARASVPPPPQGHRIHGGPISPYPPQVRPPSRTTPQSQPMVPPSRLMSPPQGQAPPRQPTPSQYAPPLPRGPAPGETPLAGQYARPPLQGHIQPPPQSHPPPGMYARATPPPSGQYVPPPAAQQHHPQQQSGPYGPPQGIQRPMSSQLPPQSGPPPPPPPPPPGGPSGAPPRVASTIAPAARSAPPPPKYPPGDRSHIPDTTKPAYNIILDNLNRMKQTTPPNQKRLVDDLERRLNPLFDALNCETLSKPVVDQLVILTRAIEARDRPAALAIHVDLLTRGSQTDDIGLWMSGVKQLIMRL